MTPQALDCYHSIIQRTSIHQLRLRPRQLLLQLCLRRFDTRPTIHLTVPAMAGDETTPLLSRTASPSGSHRSHGSIYISVLNTRSNASESTPLLLEGPERASQDDDDQSVPSPQDHRPASPDSRSIEKNRRIRWPIVIALAALCLAVITILVLGFVAPSAIQEYAKEAAVFEPISLSIAAFTQSGVRTRVRASFYLDASRVEKPIVRNIGRFVTWVGKEVESGESKILVYLPEYKNALVGTAKVPPVKVNIRNGHTNFVDVFADLEPGDLDEIRQVGNQWLEGRLDQLRVKGVTSIPLRSGLLQLGAQDIAETFVLQGQSLYSPFIPSDGVFTFQC